MAYVGKERDREKKRRQKEVRKEKKVKKNTFIMIKALFFYNGWWWLYRRLLFIEWANVGFIVDHGQIRKKVTIIIIISLNIQIFFYQFLHTSKNRSLSPEETSQFYLKSSRSLLQSMCLLACFNYPQLNDLVRIQNPHLKKETSKMT